MVETVLGYLEKDNKYLMLYRNKKKKDVNAGKWIGIGGHIEEGETPEEALIRECMEETSLTLLSYSLRGKLIFNIDGYEETCYLYTSSSFVGNIKECDEGELAFVDKKDVFHLPLWEGDIIFLKMLQDNEPYFVLRLIYENDKLISYSKEN
ncbi:MAG: NUDIX hydrolase [Bacilli bacterium]